MAGSEHGEPIRGFGRRRLVGKEMDPLTGQMIDVYELSDDDEWAYSTLESERHLRDHQRYYDPQCQYCNLQFKVNRG